jgi:hypothetical protein
VSRCSGRSHAHERRCRGCVFVIEQRSGCIVAHLEPAKLGLAPDAQSETTLLTVAELPTGWAVDNSPQNGSVPQCIKALDSTFGISHSTEGDFVKGTDFPEFKQALNDLGTSAAAVTRYQAGAAILNDCKDVSYVSDGQRITGSIGALSFPQVGQQSSAWQMVLSTQGETVGIDVVLVQKGSELLLMNYDDIDSPDLDEATSFARKAAAKIPAT